MPAENLRSGLENVQKKKSGETYGNINLGVPSVTEVSRHGFRGEPRIKAFAKEHEKESELMENNESPIDKPKTINDLEKLYVRQTLHDKFNLVSDQHQLSEIGEKRQKAKDRAMITLKTEMTIPNVSPDEFFLALLTLDDPIYKAMAPKQHIKFEIIDEKDRIDGTTYHFHEKVGEL